MRLICLGDSWTEGDGIETQKEFANDILTVGDGFFRKLRQQNSWCRFLANKLNCVYVNLGKSGSSNFDMFFNINSLIKKNIVTKDDIIIIYILSTYIYLLLINNVD